MDLWAPPLMAFWSMREHLFYFIFIYLFILRFVLPTWLRGSYTIKANYLFIICLFNLLVSELSIYFLS